jgi:hypothetical protein
MKRTLKHAAADRGSHVAMWFLLAALLPLIVNVTFDTM